MSDQFGDLDILRELLASPTLSASDVGLAMPAVATDDDPADRDGDEPGACCPA